MPQLESLRRVELLIADLPGTLLGIVWANTVYFDSNVAGFGWFIDPTRGLDEEFELVDSSSELHTIDASIVDRMDLLTVVLHELGHILGLPNLDPLAGSLVGSTLQPDHRYRPAAAERDAYFAALV